MIEYELEKFLDVAKKDKILKSKILATKQSQDPLNEFCKIAQNLGYKIYLGELLACGQDLNDTKLRSVNGGGVNGIDGWDDAYEQFILTLQWC